MSYLEIQESLIKAYRELTEAQKTMQGEGDDSGELFGLIATARLAAADAMVLAEKERMAQHG